MNRSRAMTDSGFTLVELLVVVLIIGVLVAIAIPVFLGQQNQAKDAAIKADLASAKVAMVGYAVSHDNAYLGVSSPTATAAALHGHGYAPSVGTASGVEVKSGGPTFCLQGTSATGSVFHITANSAVVAGSC